MLQLFPREADFERPTAVLAQLVRKANQLVAQPWRDILRGDFAKTFFQLLEPKPQQACDISSEHRIAVGNRFKRSVLPDQGCGGLRRARRYQIVATQVRFEGPDKLPGPAESENHFPARRSQLRDLDATGKHQENLPATRPLNEDGLPPQESLFISCRQNVAALGWREIGK